MPLFKQRRAGRRGTPAIAGAPLADSAARREGDRSRDEGRWSEAAAGYREHLETHPDDFAIWVQLGNCLKEAGASEAALAAYQRAIVLDGSGDADVFLQFGHVLKLLGRHEDAIAAYRTSLTRRPQDNPALDELRALGGVAEAGQAQPINLGRALRTIENQLHRLVEAFAARDAATTAGAGATPSPLPAVTAAKAKGPTIFLVLDPPGGRAAPASGFAARLGQAFREQGISVRFVRWSRDAGNFRLLANDPSDGGPPVVVAASSCGEADWLLVAGGGRAGPQAPDLIEMDMIMAGKRLGLRSAFVFHGAEPLRLRRYAGRGAEAHEQTMQALLLADAILPVSNVAANDLTAFFVQHQKADALPLIKKISPPEEGRGEAATEWADYVRRVRGLLADAADASHHLAALYYWIDPAAAAQAVFARHLARAFREWGIGLIPAAWDAKGRRLTAASGESLSDWTSDGGASPWAEWIDPREENAPRWLLLPGALPGERVAEATAFAKAQRLRTAAILHEPADGSGEEEQDFFRAVAGLDKVFAVSERRFRDFNRFLLSWRGKVHSAEHRFKLLGAPNEMPGRRRRVAPKRASPGSVRILIVVPSERPSDLAVMLDAAAEAAERSANRLIFAVAGSPPGLSAAERQMVAAKIAAIPDARWEDEAGSEGRDQLFAAADFVIVAGVAGESAAAVTESLWRGLPCLVHGGAARSPDVPGTGLAHADMRDRSALAEAILRLADPEWRRCLANEAVARPARLWSEYAREIAVELATDRLSDGVRPIPLWVRGDVYRTFVNLRRRPRLSLCISTYNRAGWLEVTLRNIFAQIPRPRGDLEVLVVDNASPDRTPEAVKPYLARADFRCVRNAKNVGMLGNLAVTVQQAKGEYVWILGDDDLTRAGAIERIIEIIGKHPGIGLIYLNYGYTCEDNPARVGDLGAFLDGYNTLEPAGPDEFAPVHRLAAKCENFFTAIYSHVYRRDHALKAYCQNTSGRIFSTMLSCVPTAYYVLNYMADEPAYWVGEPSLVVNSNVSWQDYGALLDLEQLPRAWDLAERMGADPAAVDRRRANRLWLVKLMWKDIFENDKAGNSAYFSASRVLMRLKHLKEFDEHVDELRAVYERARKAGHPAATMPADELFSAFDTAPSALAGAIRGLSAS